MIFAQMLFFGLLLFGLTFHPCRLLCVMASLSILSSVYLRVNGWEGVNVKDKDGAITIFILLFSFVSMHVFWMKNPTYFTGFILQAIAMIIRIDYTSFFKKE